MNESKEVTPSFPIFIKFEDGSIESFPSVESLETDLEVFDSETCPECEVKDALGRPVRLRVNDHLVLEELSLIDQGQRWIRLKHN